MMKIYSEEKNITGLQLAQNQITENCIATIGFFDGIHLGHKFILSKLKERAKKKGLESLVITMWQHPQLYFGKDIKLLSSFQEKIDCLKKLDIDNLVILNFNQELANTNSKDFIEKILKNRFKISEILLGYNNNFGCDFSKNINFNDFDIPIERLEKFVSEKGEKISSSEIRKLLANGEIEKANEFLDYKYSLYGTVEHGFKIGKEIGFPTANVLLDEKDKLIPKNGVYATETSFDNIKYYKSLLYVGNRPSFNGEKLTIENHILNFDGNVYGKKISIRIFKKIRDEIKFPDKSMLIDQLKKDINTTKIFFESSLTL